MRPLQLAHSMRWPPVPGAWWSHCLGVNSRCLGVRSRSPRNLYLHHCKMYNCTQMLVQRIHPNVWKSVLEFSLPFASSSPTVSCSKQPHGIGRLHRWPRSHKSAAPFRLRHAAHGPSTSAWARGVHGETLVQLVQHILVCPDWCEQSLVPESSKYNYEVIEVCLTSASTSKYSLYLVRKQGYQKTRAVWDLLGDYSVSFAETPDQGLGHVTTQAYRPQVKGWSKSLWMDLILKGKVVFRIFQKRNVRNGILCPQ